MAPLTFVDLERGRVEVEEIPGDPASAPLVFLHEGLGSVGLWRGFPAEVAAATGRRTVVYSRYGHGRSDPPAEPHTHRFMHEEALDVLPELLGRLGIEKPVLIGHSDGASISIIHAARHPVASMVLMAPHVYVEEMAAPALGEAREAFWSGGLRERMARHHDDPEVTFRGWNDVWTDPGFRTWNIEDCAAAITCPVLLVQGVDDEYGTIAQLDAIEHRAHGPVRRLPLDCRHQPHLERREDTLAAIAAFVAGR
jgi:pimeloyl-ACP methyl ester carboxylesterase